MKLNPPPRQRLRVHELAAELGWTSRQLLTELGCRGEFVKSASSTLEAPVVRAIRRDFATVTAKCDRDSACSPQLYGQSADMASRADDRESFEGAVRRVKSQSKQLRSVPAQSKWTLPILQALVVEVAAMHGGNPTSRDRRQASHLHREWAAACLHGLNDTESTVIKWIRVSGGGRPMLAAELSDAGITPDEASLHLGYDGRIDPRWPSIFDRYRDRKINRSEAIVAVRRWRENHAAG